MCELVINSEEARRVNQIYECYLAGHGYTAIAKGLNGDPKFADINKRFFEGDRPSSPGHLINPIKYSNPHSWCPSCIREMLYRDRYRGMVKWGRKQNFERGGRVHLRRSASADKIITVEIPELRIISDELWQKIHRWMKAVRKNYVRNDKSHWWGRPESGKHSKYLLSGLIRCKSCGGSMIATTFTRNAAVSDLMKLTVLKERLPDSKRKSDGSSIRSRLGRRQIQCSSGSRVSSSR